MKKKNFYLIVTFLLLISFFSNTESTEFFTEKESFWFGGSFSYATIWQTDYEMSEDKYKMHIFYYQTFLRYFPRNFFAFGPRFEWTRIKDDNNDDSNDDIIRQFGHGVDIAFVYGKNPHVIPYALLGIQIDFFDYWYYSEQVGEEGEGGIGYSLPIEVGIIFAVKGIGIQLEPSFQLKYYENYMTKVFSISIGFCAIGKKTAVSLMHSIPYFFHHGAYDP